MSISSVTTVPAVRWWKPLLFLAVVVIGLWFVKWQPYYGKALLAAETHNIGHSLLADVQGHPLKAAWRYAQIYFLAVWKAAVLGIILGSLIQVLIPRRWLLTLFGKGRFSGPLLAAMFSLPGMMCTCCAAPVAVGMRKCSVPASSTLAFWLGNPLLNPATLIFMGFVLGWQFSAIRLVIGLVTVFSVAFVVQKMMADEIIRLLPEPLPVDERSFLQRWAASLWSLFWQTVPVYLLAVLALGAAQVWLFPHTQGTVDNSLWWVVAMAVAGALFVIPTAAEIPIVQTMMLAGMGIAPALALLITLPALSVPSLIMLRRAFPAKALWLTLGLVILCGILTGTLALLWL
jgi:uncharacterized membrane protein YraQ (UPF0718 family)